MTAAAELREKHGLLMQEYGEMGVHITALQGRRAKVLGDLLHLVVTAKLFGEELALPANRQCAATYRPKGQTGEPTVRDYTIAQLTARPEGMRSREVTDAYARDYGIQLHPKTGGMTLYRLMQDGIARREGRIWFRRATEQAAGDEVREQVRRQIPTGVVET